MPAPLASKPTVVPPLGETDRYLWHLDSSDGGRHVWHYDRPESNPTPYEALWGPDEGGVKLGKQTVESKFMLGLPLPLVEGLEDPEGDLWKAAKKGYEFYKRVQGPDGHWAGESSGPLFLMPGLVFALHITQTPLPQEWKIEISRYLANVQRDNGESDSGWGIDTRGSSTVFGTALNYIVLRIFGVDPDVPMMVRARTTLHALGGCRGIPSWGKVWLCLLNLYSWEGVNPLPPEMWLLPDSFPLHPHRWWCQTRNVFTPMSYLYSKRFQQPLGPLIWSLRFELFNEDYSKIRWHELRNFVCPKDLYQPHHWLADLSFFALGVVEPWIPFFVRKRATDFAYSMIVMEDENTTYQSIAPVSKALNMICRWVEEGPSSDAHRMHVSRVRDFFWMGEKGMTVCGTNGSQQWDIAFMAQALFETGLAKEPQNISSATRIIKWLDQAQIREDQRWSKEAYRHPTKGGWTFSTKEQAYPVSDCTSESLKAVMMLQSLSGVPNVISKERLQDSIDFILTYQNPDGGFSSFEPIRGPSYLELLNTSELFARIMTDYSYPECTTACLTALARFSATYPKYRSSAISKAKQRGFQYIRNTQRPDGSWYGSWGVCFTYATMFALESLSMSGESYSNSEAVRRACRFLISVQRSDGGWGESFRSCEEHRYIQHEETSQVVNTSWAILGLIHAQYPELEPLRRGASLIASRQRADGSWDREGIEGVFNHAVAFTYPNFRFSWTIWALGKVSNYSLPV
ncbi:terpene synthase [Meredithblackwellia eburnea MCA 4105]